MWSMSKEDGSLVTSPSYLDRHSPPRKVQPAVTHGLTTASLISTSSQLSHPS
jgi:hypothetical protein